MEPNEKDLAELALLGVRLHILTPAAVVAWADGLIAQTDTPADWVIDLALAAPKSLEADLKQVPGEAQPGLSVHLFLALVFRRWRSGRLTMGDVCSIRRRLEYFRRLEYSRTVPEGYDDWSHRVFCEFIDFDNRLRTDDELRMSIDQLLAEYSDVEWMLPAWVDHCGQVNSKSVGNQGPACPSPVISPTAVSTDREDDRLLPAESDFDPTGTDLDAHWAWLEFGGLTVREAEHKFHERPDLYLESLSCMGEKAFAFYFPAVEAHFRNVPTENEDGDDYGAEFIPHSIKNQFVIKKSGLVLQLVPRVVAISKYVQQNINRFGNDADEKQRIVDSCVELENHIRLHFLTFA